MKIGIQNKLETRNNHGEVVELTVVLVSKDWWWCKKAVQQYLSGVLNTYPELAKLNVKTDNGLSRTFYRKTKVTRVYV
jgi:hypothetical protein